MHGMDWWILARDSGAWHGVYISWRRYQTTGAVTVPWGQYGMRAPVTGNLVMPDKVAGYEFVGGLKD